MTKVEIEGKGNRSNEWMRWMSRVGGINEVSLNDRKGELLKDKCERYFRAINRLRLSIDQGCIMLYVYTW